MDLCHLILRYHDLLVQRLGRWQNMGRFYHGQWCLHHQCGTVCHFFCIYIWYMICIYIYMHIISFISPYRLLYNSRIRERFDWFNLQTCGLNPGDWVGSHQKVLSNLQQVRIWPSKIEMSPQRMATSRMTAEGDHQKIGFYLSKNGKTKCSPAIKTWVFAGNNLPRSILGRLLSCRDGTFPKNDWWDPNQKPRKSPSSPSQEPWNDELWTPQGPIFELCHYVHVLISWCFGWRYWN